MSKAILLGALLALAPGSSVAAAEEGRSVIHERAEDVQPLLPGMRPPAFTLRDATGQPVAFDPDGLKKPLIITFFRGGWCPYCNLHLAELRHAEAELKSMGFDLWFISVDRPEKLYASLEDPEIGYVVYSDAELQASRAFGIAFRVADEVVARYREYGVDLEDAAGQAHHVLPAPSTYLIGADGVIRFQYTNPDYTHRLHPDVLLAAARVYRDDLDARLRRAYEARQE
jgi:peroxiredoxin